MTDLLTTLASGDINLFTGLLWLIIATGLSVVGGAIGGILLAGEELGYEFAATIGGLFAPAGVIPAMVLGLLLLNFCPKF
ncbi:hypothetical protein CEN45_07100 [Fischerella thermalis CCMEE 5198]|jgi:hypothetical protein|uniref:hypothetical protein n=1 Tax=Fischerella thermalis TaxID=372787 RepID=UPI000C800FD4|nr:hypothetical protein [Fischerella thermalis]PLZ85133.1 hypothetical protein CI594_23285 [Fischerella thermalis CCMEE 5196]PMB24933.1 hypothetical protein CEN45_07100 [Fischerella thermalis CCMEE 5198]PMB53676.1 hypothetical protein CEN39_03150 [Fischerella thermalis CCMEE 5201]